MNETLFPDETIRKSATISPCGQYRYDLTRRWDHSKPDCVFIGLNPSTADAEQDDPTIRRCIAFAKREGCGGLVMLNLFAYRATEPKDMMKAQFPVGERNYDFLHGAPRFAKVVICAWGALGGHQNQDSSVILEIQRLGVPMKCLGLTNKGMPRHPLYIRADQKLIDFAVRKP